MRSKILSQLPLAELRALAVQLLAGGMSADAVVDELVAFVDGLVDWRTVIKGIGGEIAEAADGPIARAILVVIVAVAKLDKSAA
jgi:hypothetical protein